MDIYHVIKQMQKLVECVKRHAEQEQIQQGIHMTMTHRLDPGLAVDFHLVEDFPGDGNSLYCKRKIA